MLLDQLAKRELDRTWVDPHNRMSSIISNNGPTLDLEAIPHQGNTKFEALTELFRTLRSKSKREDRNDAMRAIMAWTSKTIGITVSFFDIGSISPQAWCRIPIVDRNHPYYNAFKTKNFNFKSKEELVSNVSKGKFNLPSYEATIDLKNARVGGVYSEIEATIGLSRYFTDDSVKDGTNVEESAAVYLHEVGHAFSLFLFMGRSYSTNIVLAQAQAALNGQTDTKVIKDILVATGNQLDIAKEDMASIAEVKDKVVRERLLVGAVSRKVFSTMGSWVYDRRAMEHFSDYFAFRMGAGVHIATVLYRDDEKLGRAFKQASSIKFLSSAFEFMAYVVNPFNWINVLFLSWNGEVGTHRAIYGRDYERFDAILRQQLELIKEQYGNKGYDDETRRVLLEQYEELLKMRNSYDESRSMTEWLNDVWQSKQFRISEEQRTLEKMNASALFAEVIKI